MEDPYELSRFVEAQDGGTYDAAVSELRTGRKVTHWMWFVFPQVVGLGHSWMSKRFAISSLDEAQAYLRHPVLGPRLVECARILLATSAKTPSDIFGFDAVKLRSSMTLFMMAAPHEAVFREVVDKYFQGAPDQETLARL
jgi:uncharacterized protein (DUF1810 family)